MSPEERERLFVPVEEYDAVVEALELLLRLRPGTPGAREALAQAERTYQQRMYSEFERILRDRLPARPATPLAAAVQAFVGESRTLDPATGRWTEWWRVVTRDRNHLAHGYPVPPALQLRPTYSLLESFQSSRRARKGPGEFRPRRDGGRWMLVPCSTYSESSPTFSCS